MIKSFVDNFIKDIYKVGLSGIVMQAVGSLTVALINFIIKTKRTKRTTRKI